MDSERREWHRTAINAALRTLSDIANTPEPGRTQRYGTESLKWVHAELTARIEAMINDIN